MRPHATAQAAAARRVRRRQPQRGQPRERSSLAFAVAAALAATHLAAQAAPDPAAGPATGSLQNPPEGSADWYDLQARTAVERHGYEAAAKLLGEAKRAFPDDVRFNLALASLYYDEQLWRLALDEYVEAERKGTADPEQYARIARCLGKLDRNREAVGWLERATEQWPGTRSSWTTSAGCTSRSTGTPTACGCCSRPPRIRACPPISR